MGIESDEDGIPAIFLRNLLHPGDDLLVADVQAIKSTNRNYRKIATLKIR